MKQKNSILGAFPVMGRVIKDKKKLESYQAGLHILSSIPKTAKAGKQNSGKSNASSSKPAKKRKDSKEHHFLSLLLQRLEVQKFVKGIASIGAVKKRKSILKKDWKSIVNNFISTPAYIKLSKLLTGKAGIQPNTCFSEDPVNLATGNFIYSTEDISTNGRFAILFTRFYNAIDQFEGVIGKNWHSSFDVYAEKIGKDKIEINFDDGHKACYIYDNGSYLLAGDPTSMLEENEDKTLTLYLSYGKIHFNTEGKMLWKQDNYLNKTNFEYKKNTLVQVSNPSGIISFQYNEKGYISRIKDHTGRSVSYEYDCGNLVRVTDVNGNQTQYSYYSNGLLKEIINPLDVSVVGNFYDESGRTVKQSFPDRGSMFYRYNDAEGTTTLEERNGEKIVYHRDKDHQITQVEYWDGSETFSYDESSHLIQYMDKNSNSYSYEYTSTGQCRKETDPLGYTTKYHFDSFDVLTKKETANGAVQEYTYDSDGNLMEMINPLGVKDCLSYDKKGNPTHYRKDGVELLKLEYDERGNITSLTDGDGNVTYYEYDSLNRESKMILPEGGETLFQYAPNGKVSKIINAYQDSMDFDYDPAENMIAKKDFSGQVTKYEYNKMNQLIHEVDPLGNECHYLYNEMWDVICETDKNGADTIYEYDGLQRMTARIDGEGNRTEYTYDPNGNLTSVKNPRGDMKIYEYDELNRIVKYSNEEGATTQLFYDSVGNTVKILNPEGNEIHYEYDLLDQVTKVTDEMGAKTSYAYNCFGLVEKVVEPDGGVYEIKYNYAGKPIQLMNPMENSMEFAYNKNGKIRWSKEYSEGKTYYTYDKLDRLTEVTDPLGNCKKYEYDKADNVTKITDENGNETKYVYDPIGNLIQVMDAKDRIIQYAYDPNSNLICMDRYGIVNKTCFEYDKRNLQLKRTDTDGKSISYEYDAMGNLINKKNRAGEETKAEYTASGFLSKIMYSDHSSIEYIYNQLGKLTEVREWAAKVKEKECTLTIQLDPKGRPIHTKEKDGAHTYFRYNHAGETTYIKYPDGYEVNYEYDKAGRLAEVIDGDHNRTSYTYGEGKEVKEILYPNRWRTTYQYDSFVRLESQQSLNSVGTVMEELKYQYDPVGNRIMQEKKERNEFPERLFLYRDKEGTIFEDTGTTRYNYDGCNQLVEVKRDKGMATHYEYDRYGNRVRMESLNGNECRTVTYRYDWMNRLLKEEISSADTENRKMDVKQYSYNPNGDLISVEKNGQDFLNYFYNSAGKLTAMEENTGKHSAFSYDGIGRRVKNIDSAESGESRRETNYVLDYTKQFDNVLMTYGIGDTTRRYIRGSNLVSVTEIETNRQAYYFHDLLGSPTRLVDEQGLTESAYRYDEYGNTYELERNCALYGYSKEYPEYHQRENYEKGKVKNIFGFTGYQCHDSMELYFAQERYYDSKLGRFTQQDSLENASIEKIISWNLYGYCENNPGYYVDPLGLMENPAKNANAKVYYKEHGIDNYKATERMVLKTMVTGNPNNDGHTVAEILVHDCLIRRMKFKRVALETSVKVKRFPDAIKDTTNYIDILAVTHNGTVFIYDIKSESEMKIPGKRREAVDKIKGYYDAIKCEKNSEARELNGIFKYGDQRSTLGIPFEVTLLKFDKYEVRMQLIHTGNGIYEYEINIYFKDKRKKKQRISQAALKNIAQHRKMLNEARPAINEAKQIIRNAIAASILTVAGLTVSSAIATIISALGSASALSKAPALSSYVAKEVPKFVAGTSAAIKRFQPQIEKALKPIVEDVINFFDDAA